MPQNKLDHSRLVGKMIIFFIIALAMTSITERILNHVEGTIILPRVEAMLFPGVVAGELQTSAVALIFLLLIIAMLLTVLRSLFPFLEVPVDAAGRWIIGVVAQLLNEDSARHSLEGVTLGKALLFLIILLLNLVLFCLPYVIAAWCYIGFIVKEMEQVRKHEEDVHAKYEQARNLMLSDIAHDLRNPITTVAGYAKALEDGMVKDPEQQKQYLSAIQKKSLRINELINLLFEYSKLNTADFKLDREQLDVNELLRENAALMYEDIEGKGMTLNADIPEEPWMLKADKLQLSRAVTNLITNAIRHNPSGTEILVRAIPRLQPAPYVTYKQIVEGEVDLSKLDEMQATADREHRLIGYDNDRSFIIIADTGAQIPAGMQEHIFEPFIIGDASRSTKGGSGLGLSIAAKVIEMHGWGIKLVTNYPGYTKAFVIMIS